MNRIVSALALTATLVASTAAFAGEPTGRYQGAVGQVPDGVEQAATFEHSYAGRGGVTAVAAANIPAAQNVGEHEYALLQQHGRAFNVSAMDVPNGAADYDVRLADLLK